MEEEEEESKPFRFPPLVYRKDKKDYHKCETPLKIQDFPNSPSQFKLYFLYKHLYINNQHDELKEENGRISGVKRMTREKEFFEAYDQDDEVEIFGSVKRRKVEGKVEIISRATGSDKTFNFFDRISKE